MDLLRIFNFPINYLKVLGFWPWDNSAKSKRIIVASIVLSLLMSGNVLLFLSLLKSKNLKELAQPLSINITYIGVVAKVINLLLKAKKIGKLMDTLKDLLQHGNWLANNGRSVSTRVKNANLIFCVRLTVIISGVTANFIVAITSHRLTYKLDFLPDSDLIFHCLNVYQYIYNLLSGPLIIILDFLPIFFLCFAIGFYQELNKLFVAMEMNVNQVELKRLIEIEIKIRSFLDEIMECFSIVILIQAGSVAVQLCSISFSLSAVSNYLHSIQIH